MKKLSVLFVDDQKIVRRAVEADLKHMGYDVALAENGEEAVKILQQRKTDCFDIVISDLMMEGLSGVDVLKEAKNVSPETIVIILTGYGSLESAIDSIRLDVDDYILKPSKPNELKFRISRCVERRDLKRKIKLYENILPVCCACNKIRDDDGKERGTGEWMDWEVYNRKNATVKVSHGYCPVCYEEAMKEVDRLVTPHKI